MNRLDIASLFCQFLQLNRSAVATIEMIAELIDSIVELPHRRWYIGICFWYNWRADRPVHGRTPAASGRRCTVDGRETTTEELVVFQINFYSNSVSVN